METPIFLCFQILHQNLTCLGGNKGAWTFKHFRFVVFWWGNFPYFSLLYQVKSIFKHSVWSVNANAGLKLIKFVRTDKNLYKSIVIIKDRPAKKEAKKIINLPQNKI